MFQVRWEVSASNELAAAWVAADSALRQAITAAAHIIDQRLQHDPLNQGESRGGADHVLFEFPLGVRYEIDQQHSVVSVLHVWTYKRRGG